MCGIKIYKISPGVDRKVMHVIKFFVYLTSDDVF
jgi:hypothetical protein